MLLLDLKRIMEIIDFSRLRRGACAIPLTKFYAINQLGLLFSQSKYSCLYENEVLWTTDLRTLFFVWGGDSTSLSSYTHRPPWKSGDARVELPARKLIPTNSICPANLPALLTPRQSCPWTARICQSQLPWQPSFLLITNHKYLQNTCNSVVW